MPAEAGRMATNQDTASDPGATWRLIPHVCRHCVGRLLERVAEGDERMIRCADCGATVTGHHGELCWCGANTGLAKVKLACMPNPGISPESLSEIVAGEMP
jgi:hypothetical protein